MIINEAPIGRRIHTKPRYREAGRRQPGERGALAAELAETGRRSRPVSARERQPTSPIACSAADRSMASQIAAARARRRRSAVPREPPLVLIGVHRRVRVVHVVLEALRIALGVPGRQLDSRRCSAEPWLGSRTSIWVPASAPIQSCSGSSWSKTALRCMPSISTQSRFLRPALSWVITAEPAMSLAVRNKINAESSVSTSISGASLSTALMRRRGRGRALLDRDRGGGDQLGDLVAGHPLDQVAPVRADVTERPGGPPCLGIDPPAGRAGVEQPVLQVAAVDQVDRAELLALHAGPHLPHHRVEPVGERHGVDHARSLGRGRRLLGVVEADAQRLLAQHMLAGRHQPDRRRARARRWECRCARPRRHCRRPVDVLVRLLGTPALGDLT